MSQLEKVLVHPFVSTHFAFAFLPADHVIAGPTNVFLLDTYAAFAALQGRVHEVWARLNASSMKDDLRYTPTDCFETFPFPEHWRNHPELEAAGQACYEHRAALMIANDEGLTKTYNRFHDEACDDPGIIELRRLHAAMDLAMIKAYGWDPDDFDLECQFLAIHAGEDDEDHDAEKPERPIKKRLRWPDETRDKVLGLLLELNERQARGTAMTSGPNAENHPDAVFALAAPSAAPAAKKPRKKSQGGEAAPANAKPAPGGPDTPGPSRRRTAARGGD